MTTVPFRSVLPFLRRVAASATTPRGFLALLALGAGLVAIEVHGRGTPSDGADLVAALALGVVLLVAGTLRGTAWQDVLDDLRALGPRLGRALAARWPTLGVDFTNDEDTVRRVPPFVVRASVGLGIAFVGVALWSAASPVSLRALIAPRAYLLWFALFLALWAGLLLLGAAGILLPILSLRHLLWSRGRLKPGAVRVAAVPWFLALGVLAWVLPAEVALLCAVTGVVLTVLMGRLLRIPRLTLLWRTAADGRVAGIDWATGLWQMSVLPTAAMLLVISLGLGGRWAWWPTPPSTTPLTGLLAHVVAWLLGPALLAYVLLVFRSVGRLAATDPAAPSPTRVHLTVRAEEWDETRVRALFRARGWGVGVAPERAERTDVPLILVDPPMPRPAPGRPLAVSERALEVPELLDLIARRDVLRRRRILRRGLERLLKEIRRRSFGRGLGVWLAPHLWWAGAATRDTSEDDLSEEGLNDEIGTPYADLLPLPVRHHLHVVLRAIEVDIILLEDGVRWSAFRRVLDRIFGHYDRDGGRIEERDFAGILGVRVILHDLVPGGRLEVLGYPEPDYEDLARGRILHVFRDRGGLPDEPEPAPTEDTGVPVGMAG